MSKQLAKIEIGKSEFAPEFWKLLEESGIEPQEFEDLDYFSYLPFFVLAGASVQSHTQAHGDHSHFEGATVSIEPELEEAFYFVLPQLLEQIEPT